MSVERKTDVKDAIGSNVPTWAARTIGGSTSVPCYFAPASTKTIQEFARNDMVVEYEVYTAIDVAATLADRLLKGGIYYNVIGYKPFTHPTGGQSVYVTIVGKRNQ